VPRCQGLFDLQSVIESQCDALQPHARERALLLTVVPANGFIGAVGDLKRVRQVIRNRVSNAAKFSDHGNVVVRMSSSGPTAGIEVQDHGIGIAEHLQSTVFQPLRRLANANNRVRPGTGLGLSISRRLIDAMGGTISVTSRLSRRSTFWFTLPLAGAPAAVDGDVKSVERR
jgi:signal transduction histidine kinase